jgi:hypothetical protein
VRDTNFLTVPGADVILRCLHRDNNAGCLVLVAYLQGLLFNSEDGGRTIVRKVGKLLPVCLGMRHPSGTYDQIFISVRQLGVC